MLVFLTIDLEPGVECTAIDFSTESIETFNAQLIGGDDLVQHTTGVLDPGRG
jgi:hypothetical protein